MSMTKEELIEFEIWVAQQFNDGKIHAPVHLVGGNEEVLIDIFKDIKPKDWVFSTHRSHYHSLLKGIPVNKVKKEILVGHSICLNFPAYRFRSSAIVGGNLPQAVGVALTGQRVWAFTGDMASQTGIFSECVRFSQKQNLPITFVIEDNGVSVQTPTSECWPPLRSREKAWHYRYKNTWPHQGTGVNVVF